MDGARMILGATTSGRSATGSSTASIQYVVASDQGWSPVRTLTVRDGLTLDQAIPLVENLAR